MADVSAQEEKHNLSVDFLPHYAGNDKCDLRITIKLQIADRHTFAMILPTAACAWTATTRQASEKLMLAWIRTLGCQLTATRKPTFVAQQEKDVTEGEANLFYVDQSKPFSP
jgi:hypothetical protein